MRLRPLVVHGLAFLALTVVGRLSVEPITGLAFFWPAAGVAVAWLLTVRTWRDLVAALVVVTVVAGGVNLITGAPPGSAALLALGNLAMAALPRRVILMLRGVSRGLRLRQGIASPGRSPAALPVIDRPRHFLLLLTGVAVAAVVSSPSALLALVVRDAAVTPLALAGWVVRNGVGALTVGGTVLAVAGTRANPGRFRRARGLETAALFVATLGATWLVFRPGQPLALTFLPTGVVVWAGMRLRPGWAAAQGLLLGVSTVVLVRFLHGGPFASTVSPAVEVAVIQLYVGLVFSLALVVSLVASERDAFATRMRRSEETARDQAEQLRAITETMQEGLVVVDRAGRHLLQNPVADILFADPEPGPSGTPERLPLCALDGSPLSDQDVPSARALRGEVVRGFPVLHRYTDGRVRVFAVDAAPLWRSSTGQPDPSAPATPDRAVVLFRDITAEHERVELLETFAGTVAHDLQNPIASVHGWTENAFDELDDTERPDQEGRVRTSLMRISSSANRAQNLIDDLLGYSRARTATMKTETVDLDELVSQIAREVAEGLPGRDVRIDHGPLGPITADRGMLRQLFGNLIGNAVKYTDSERSPRVMVTVRRTAENLDLLIADNGIGVPAGHRELIFDAFHRAPTRARFPGTGLGLAICALVARRHGGTIEVEDRPDGPGSVFTVHLPTTVVLADPAVDPAAGTSTADGPGHRSRELVTGV